METVTYSRARQHLAEITDKVNDDRAPVLISRQNGKAVVMMSLANYNAIEETAYLSRSPRNARRLMAAVEQLVTQGGTVRELVPDAD